MMSERERRRRNIILYADHERILWARRIAVRDNHTCRVCSFKMFTKHGTYPEYGESHHIEHDMNLKYIDSNGLWLCLKCHSAIHHINIKNKYLVKHPELAPLINALHNIFYKNNDTDKKGE